MGGGGGDTGEKDHLAVLAALPETLQRDRVQQALKILATLDFPGGLVGYGSGIVMAMAQVAAVVWV